MLLKAFVDHYRTLGDAFLATFPRPFLVEEGRLELEGQAPQVARRAFYLMADPGGALVIGRKEQADLRVLDRNVSGQHARLLAPATADGPWRIVDLGSTNGTFLNGEKLVPGKEATLADEALLGFGPIVQYVFLEPPTFLTLLRQIDAKEPRVGLHETDEFDLRQTSSRMAAVDGLSGAEEAVEGPSPEGGLYVVSEAFDPVQLRPGQKLVVGRSQAQADLVLPHPQVSRMHAELCWQEDGRILVRDLHSANGVAVNGLKLGPEPVEVGVGAVVVIADFTMRLVGSVAEQAGSTVILTPKDVREKKKLIRGSFSKVPLSQILAGIEDKAKSGRLEISGPDGYGGEIVFRAGKPWRAKTSNGRHGADALRHLLRLTEGTFAIDPTLGNPGEREITESFSELVLEDFFESA